MLYLDRRIDHKFTTDALKMEVAIKCSLFWFWTDINPYSHLAHCLCKLDFLLFFVVGNFMMNMSHMACLSFVDEESSFVTI